MSNIATTISQSRKLIELGLDQNTANMYYPYLGAGMYGNTPRVGFPIEHSGGRDIPAWSLSALLEVIPAMIVYPTWVDKRPTDVWFNLDKDYNSETKKQFYMCYYKSLDTHQIATNTDPSHSSPIDAAYEMVCWLLENNLIKKGDSDE